MNPAQPWLDWLQKCGGHWDTHKLEEERNVSDIDIVLGHDQAPDIDRLVRAEQAIEQPRLSPKERKWAEAVASDHIRVQALEEAAKEALECDWLTGPPEGKSSSLRETIAAAIRALKGGGT